MKVSFITVINPALLLCVVNKWSIYKLACGFFVIQKVTPQETKTFRYFNEDESELQSLAYIVEFLEADNAWNGVK